MALAFLRETICIEHCAMKRIERRIPCGRRRIFVQTEAGFVFGVELDSIDDVRTVKRKLKLALNVPTEERSLTFGGTVLENDMNIVGNDSPLLLTRNFMHRSSSTPCFAPIGGDIQDNDTSEPVEILGSSKKFDSIKPLVQEIATGIRDGMEPIPVRGGLGGAYYFKNSHGDNIAMVKPTDEEPYGPNNPKGFVGKALGEPGLKHSVRVGETGFREVAAYLLDYDHFASVPSTALVKVTHSIFNVNNAVNGTPRKMAKVSKIASLQQFMPHDFDASDYGTSSFPVSSVHRIGILDIRIMNTDRHAGNLLVRKLDRVGEPSQIELVPIDHGLCLPESLEDPYFEWLSWPQASIPFPEEELDYIKHLNPFQDSDMLRRELPMIRESCLRVLVLCTLFLQEAAAFGLCLADIGDMMTRKIRCHEEELSDLELICIEATKLLKNSVCHGNNKIENDEEQDRESPRQIKHGINGVILSTGYKIPTMSKVSKFGIEEKTWRYECASQKLVASFVNRCGDGHPPQSQRYVQFADMTEVEWLRFLKIFMGLLVPSFLQSVKAVVN